MPLPRITNKSKILHLFLSFSFKLLYFVSVENRGAGGKEKKLKPRQGKLFLSLVYEDEKWFKCLHQMTLNTSDKMR